MRFEDTVAVVFVRQDGHRMELVLDPRADVVPYDRPLLARLLRDLADQVESQGA